MFVFKEKLSVFFLIFYLINIIFMILKFLKIILIF
jgi:hypothetical protein